MSEVYQINVTVNRKKGISQKTGKAYDFLTYTSYTKKGKKSQIKFTKNCENVPKKEGCYTLVVPKDAINQDKTTKYLEFWVKSITSCEEFKGLEKQQEELDF